MSNHRLEKKKKKQQSKQSMIYKSLTSGQCVAFPGSSSETMRRLRGLHSNNGSPCHKNKQTNICMQTVTSVGSTVYMHLHTFSHWIHQLAFAHPHVKLRGTATTRGELCLHPTARNVMLCFFFFPLYWEVDITKVHLGGGGAIAALCDIITSRFPDEGVKCWGKPKKVRRKPTDWTKSFPILHARPIYIDS